MSVDIPGRKGRREILGIFGKSARSICPSRTSHLLSRTESWPKRVGPVVPPGLGGMDKPVLLSRGRSKLPDRPRRLPLAGPENVDVTTRNWQRGVASNLHTPNHCCFTRGSCDCGSLVHLTFRPRGCVSRLSPCVCALFQLYFSCHPPPP